MLDVVTFGSATMDIFIESDKAHIVNFRGIDGELDLYCLKYGDKIEIDHSAFEAGGGAINTAACFAKLGLKTSAAIKIGEGLDRREAKKTLKDYGIDTSFIMQTDEARTGFSIILTSFEGDRTVFAHRGANATIKKERPIETKIFNLFLFQNRIMVFNIFQILLYRRPRNRARSTAHPMSWC